MTRTLVIIYSFFFLMVLAACSHNQYSTSNKSYKKQAKQYGRMLAQYPLHDSLATATDWVGTTNFNMRKPNFVILHYTAQNSCEQTLKTFTQTKTQVSAHYVICKDGTVHHMLNDYLRAWQAGASRWGNATDINSLSIGIEIDNNGFEPFPEAQITALTKVLTGLKNTYNIPAANFIGHSDIAPGRKIDPGIYFPWQDLAGKGFGSWYDTGRVVVPVDFNAMQALRIIGYDIRKPEAAISAFKLHFTPSDTTRIITDADKKILTSLLPKYE